MLFKASSFFLFPSSSPCTFHRGHDFATRREKQKTYHRFLDTIFWEGFDRGLSLKRNGLQRAQSQKKEKPQKKCEIFSDSPFFFCQRRLFSGRFKRHNL